MAGEVGRRLMAGSQMGQGQWGKEGQMTRSKGDGRVHEGQIAVAGGGWDGMGQEFKMVGRQGPNHWVRGS